MTEHAIVDLAAVVRAWAETKPEIECLWFFGSRVKGTQRSDSDLDIAIELATDTVVRAQSARTAWLQVCEVWGGELDRVLGVETDVWHCHHDSPNVVTAVREHGLLIFDRGGQGV